MNLIIGTHFRDQWEIRVGEPMPSAEDLTRMIRDETQSICLQKFRRAHTPRGRSIVFMALYWLADFDCVVKVHEKGNKLITVMSKKMLEQPKIATDERG